MNNLTSLSDAIQQKSCEKQIQQVELESEPFFVKYPTKEDESGKIRHYIGENCVEAYFELYIWEDDNIFTRFDLHYDINNNERALSWYSNNAKISHTFVSSEKEKDFGMKQNQTFEEAEDLSINSIESEFKKRLTSTLYNQAKIDNENYNKLIEILIFVYISMDDFNN